MTAGWRVGLIAVLAAAACGDSDPPATESAPDATAATFELRIEIIEPPTLLAFPGAEAAPFPASTDLASVAIPSPAPSELISDRYERDFENIAGVPESAWRTAVVTDSAALLVASTPDGEAPFAYALFELGESGWTPLRFGPGEPAPFVDTGGDAPVGWTVRGVTATGVLLELDATACRSGATLQPEDAYALGWVVDEGLVLTVWESSLPDNADCQGRPTVTASLSLPQGSPVLLDGYVSPPRPVPANVPATPAG